MLQASLRFNVTLNGFFAHLACCTGKVASRPQCGHFAYHFPKLPTETKGSDALEFFHHLSRAIRGPNPHTHMNVIGLDRKGKHEPALLLALMLNELLASFLDLTYQDRLAAFGTPDEMIHNEVYSVLISLIFKMLVCCIHVSSIHNISTKCKG
jgi:hypothetical protein